MNEVAESTILPTENLRSPFTLNKIEIALVVFVALVTWFGLRSYLHRVTPFGWDLCSDEISSDCMTQAEAWLTHGYPIFSKYAFPLVFFTTISSIALLRSIRKDVHDMSVLGNLAIGLPDIFLIGFLLLGPYSLCSFPIGIALALVATIESGMEKRYKYNWISLPYNTAWLVVFGMFAREFLKIYGD